MLTHRTPEELGLADEQQLRLVALEARPCGSRGQVYDPGLELFRQQIDHAQQALPLTRELKNLGGETVALANIGLAQIALGEIDAGKRNMRLSIDIDERRGSISGVAQSYLESRARLGFPMAPRAWADEVLAQLEQKKAA